MRERLNRERVLRSAVELADREGLDAVSMRSLADGLGVVPMALYKHVVDKDDLVDGMVDVVIGEFAHVGSGPDWKPAVREQVLAARRSILSHRWARRAIETRTNRTPVVLGYMDRVAGMFFAGGFSADLTHHVMHVLGNRIWGFSPELFDDSRAVRRRPAASFDEMAATYPHIAQIVLATPGGMDGNASCDEQFEFEFALDLLLDGFGRLNESNWASTSARRRRRA